MSGFGLNLETYQTVLEPYNGRPKLGSPGLTWTLDRILLHTIGQKPDVLEFGDLEGLKEEISKMH